MDPFYKIIDKYKNILTDIFEYHRFNPNKLRILDQDLDTISSSLIAKQGCVYGIITNYKILKSSIYSDDFFNTFIESNMNQKVKIIEEEIIQNNNIINNLIELNKKLEFKRIEIIKKNCININNSHKWITKREKGPYGEKYTFCKFCNISIDENNLYNK